MFLVEGLSTYVLMFLVSFHWSYTMAVCLFPKIIPSYRCDVFAMRSGCLWNGAFHEYDSSRYSSSLAGSPSSNACTYYCVARLSGRHLRLLFPCWTYVNPLGISSFNGCSLSTFSR